jgi:hypothetical protein
VVHGLVDLGHGRLQQIGGVELDAIERLQLEPDARVDREARAFGLSGRGRGVELRALGAGGELDVEDDFAGADDLVAAADGGRQPHQGVLGGFAEHIDRSRVKWNRLARRTSMLLVAR